MKKTISALMLTSVLSTVSMQVFADTQNRGGHFIQRKGEKQVVTLVVKSKSEAYEIGYQKLNVFKGKSVNELAKEFKVISFSNRIKSSVRLDESHVSVSEFMNESGEIVYQGVVNLAFHYQERVYNN